MEGTRRTIGELARYGAVGVLSNAVLWLLFVACVELGVAPVVAMTVLYGVGLLQTFVANRRWTFRHEGGTRRALGRYAALYLSCYLLNLGLILGLVDHLGWPAAGVQLGAIVLIAGLQFLGQKFWVFPRG